TRVESSSLVPAGDPTLLFTNAGMVPFKDVFLGTEKRPYSRATTCQKSLRISGKHNDLENVGRTARHHTFFEMLGNFSFGDYFKEDAIKYAWEFVTVELGLPKERLWVTVFQDDDEAAALWRSCTDVFDGRILRFGEKDNFWAMGDTGPCGPCSEIFYYLGPDVANQSEEEFRKDDGTYIEIWNLVFMQFNRDPSGGLTPLPKPSVDTGMGLERVAAVKQGAQANYDNDLLRAIIAYTEKLSGKRYLGKDYTDRPTESDPQYGDDVAFRVVADHVRAAAFLVADGVSPSSDGRGYVLRRLIRRACRHGRVLGFKEAFLYRVAAEVVTLMGEAYPELRSAADTIARLVRAEEEKFLGTLEGGLAILGKEVEAVAGRGSKVFPGEAAFQLHDTFGFPLDLTEDLLKAHGLTVDHEAFSAAMEKQRERSRSARASETAQILQRAVKPTPSRFMGYEFPVYESEILGIYGQQGPLERSGEGDEVAVVTAETPFYAESGGQVGDTGSISSNGATLDVVDTQKVGGDTIVHICRVVDGELNLGDRVRLEIDEQRRRRLRIHHSATHLLHLALREVLGAHVKQAGSRVSDQSLRFDFSHYDQLTAAQMEEIEQIVNQLVQENHTVATEVLPLEDAKRSGAVALFGEKYGDSVRVVQIGPRSRELCGGTHASRSGDIGVVQIVAEGAVSAGVRRIEARAGMSALQEIRRERRALDDLLARLGANTENAAERLQKLLERSRQLERDVEKSQQQANLAKGGDLAGQAKVRADGVKVIAAKIEEATPKQLREMADDLRGRMGSGCIALGTVSDGKAVLLTAITSDLTEKYHAGELMKQVASVVGSRGGGKADLAQAGGGDPTKIDQALKRFEELVS
ncbi:MAG: alanine--tRNA ligase, partial [Bdellovibrionales bacterium]|nr:alanine--tRNA ligase [Bdellovibrionales bacterium]